MPTYQVERDGKIKQKDMPTYQAERNAIKSNGNKYQK